MSLEPEQAHCYRDGTDEAQICDDGYPVDEELLVRLERFYIDPARACQLCAMRDVWWSDTYVLRPDSVDALTPKKYASIASRLP